MIVDPDASWHNQDAPSTPDIQPGGGPDEQIRAQCPDAIPANGADGSPSVEASPPVDSSSVADPGIAASSLAREDPQVPATDMTTLASDNAAFAFDLYKKVAGDGGNLALSPVSISLALAMTYAGAATTTASEMAAALHFSLPPDRLHRAMNALDQALASRGQGFLGSDGNPMRLTIANSAWADQTAYFLPTFLDLLALNYGASVNLVDFVHAPDSSRLKINAWVSSQTQGKIPELLTADMIDDQTRLVLTNAVYFNAAWQTPFNPLATHANTFTLIDGSITTRNYMYASLSISAMQGTNFVAAALPYADSRFSMLIVVPDAGRFSEVESTLDPASLAALMDSLSYQKVSLYLPSFHVDARTSLPDALRSLGMQSAFCPAAADFSAMDGTHDLCISQVIHQAFVDVAEKGTEAGAATAVVMVDGGIAMDAGPPPLLIKAERPFLYFLYDEPTGAILFMGRVLDPVQS